jgi:hypothetical protein
MLTGTDDIIQAGLRLILWAAAYKNDTLLIDGKEWYHKVNYRNHIEKWIGGLVDRSEKGWHSRTEPIEAISGAFDFLASADKEQVERTYRCKRVELVNSDHQRARARIKIILL